MGQITYTVQTHADRFRWSLIDTKRCRHNCVSARNERYYNIAKFSEKCKVAVVSWQLFEIRLGCFKGEFR